MGNMPFLDCFPLARRIGIEITQQVFGHPAIDLEFEKLNSFFILFPNTKKRYIGRYFLHEKCKGKLDYKGIEVKRRDCAVLLKEIYKKMVQELVNMQQEDTVTTLGQKMQAVLSEELTKMVDGFYHLDKYVLSKSLSKKCEDYKVKPCHIILAQKKNMQPGERISYLIRAWKSPMPLNISAVTLDDATEQGLQPDILYYLKMFQTSIRQLCSFLPHNFVNEEFRLAKAAYQGKSHKKINSYFVTPASNPQATSAGSVNSSPAGGGAGSSS